MKSIILKICTIFLLFALIGTGCEEKEDLSYLDNTKSFYAGMPGFTVYKTKKDYFFNIPIRPYGNGFQSPELNENSGSITFFKDKYYSAECYRLNDDYVLSGGISLNYYFTSLTFDEYIREKLSPQYNKGVTNPKVINSIIDRDPFTEFYHSQESFDGKAGITITELNQLIKEKNLEKYFKKLK